MDRARPCSEYHRTVQTNRLNTKIYLSATDKAEQSAALEKTIIGTFSVSNCARVLLITVCLFMIPPDFNGVMARQADRNIDGDEFSDTGRIRAYRLSAGEQIIPDGRLDEAVWERIPVVSGFRQQFPVEGAQPSQPTEIHIAYDSQYLYIGVRLYDDPGGIRAYQKRRNQSLRADDRFMWILDTFNDGRNAYFFEINPAGLMGDGLLTIGQGTNLNKAWNGIWDAGVRITDDGWVAEIRIPFRTLDFNPDQTEWGINFQRTIRRKNEELVWTGWRQNQGLYRPQNAGLLVGLEGLTQGLGLEVKPYVSAKPARQWNPAGGGTNQFDSDAGFDITYSITPGLRTSMTVNTDFAEVEVDQRRVNLTRFPLFFPEQRDFFLEGSSLFSFAPSSGINPFFSRRIGLVRGSPVPILIGARAIGRIGSTGIGFYQIRTGKSELNEEDFTVARVVQNVGQESRIGVIYTRRSSFGDEAPPVRQTVGLDLELSTSGFLDRKNLQFQAFFVTHSINNAGEATSLWDRSTRGFRVAYPNIPFYLHASYREFGTAYDPAVGFASRNGFRRFQPTAGYTLLTPRLSWLRSLETELYFEYLMDMDFRPETVNVWLEPVNLTYESGASTKVRLRRQYERIVFPFDIRRDGSIIIPAGEYRNSAISLEVDSPPARRIYVEAEAGYQGFWTGTRTDLSGSLTVRPYPGINITGDWQRSMVDLAEGSFTTDLFRFRGNLDFTPTISFTSIIQYDNLSKLVGFYQRMRWIIRPGADLFLVYSMNWLNAEERFRPLETSGGIKLTYTFRF